MLRSVRHFAASATPRFFAASAALRLVAASAALSLVAPAAQAHHAMDGKLPATLAQGFISGLAHPVVGLDHLAFLVGAGLIAGVLGLGLWVPAVFALASILGVAIHLMEINLPLVELLIGVSVVAVGALLAAARAKLGQGAWIALFAVIGLVHGYAYGESIVGAEQTPLGAYLVGLALVQSAIGVGVAMLATRQAWTVGSLAPRLAGAVVLGVGLTAVMGQILPG